MLSSRPHRWFNTWESTLKPVHDGADALPRGRGYARGGSPVGGRRPATRRGAGARARPRDADTLPTYLTHPCTLWPCARGGARPHLTPARCRRACPPSARCPHPSAGGCPAPPPDKHNELGVFAELAANLCGAREPLSDFCPVPSKLSPVVLMHGMGLSGSVWQDVAPLLAAHHEVFTPTAVGHCGGPPIQRRPVRIWDVIDAAETYLDEAGLDRPHLVGNSMGAFVAIELARRGRAKSVCALSPAGFWSQALRARAMRKVRRSVAMGRLTRPFIPSMTKSAALRQRGMRDMAWHGDRVSPGRAIEMTDDAIGCTVTSEVFSTDEEQIAPLDRLPCPITIAWAEKDALLPVEPYEKFARARLPQATFEILPGVGHLPMIDDPELVARTILTVTGAATTAN
jgi:pimeloyl-ACP methyl ester carboxylesterase